MFLEGTVVKATGGFFVVRDPLGQEFLCRARGKLKQQQTALLVGDRVLFSPADEAPRAGECQEGVVEKRLARHNCLYRPQVANVDLLVLVVALKEPSPDWQLVNRLLVLAERQKMESLICLNKTDLLKAEELAEVIRMLEPFPYPYLLTNVVRGRGIGLLRKRLQGVNSVFAGPSGSGKSSLLNKVQPGLSLKTDTVSEKVKRGRHTTRMAELLSLDSGGAVVDTPGFSRLEFYDLQPEQLGSFFPELHPFACRCSFRDCSHISEPGCAVREAVSEKQVNSLRYEYYRTFFQELSDRRNDPRW